MRPRFRSGDPERVPAREPGTGPQFLLDPEQLVVLGNPFAPGRSAGLDLTDAQGHRQIGDKIVLGLP